MSQFYYADIIGQVEKGAKARRLGWPTDKNAKPLKHIQHAGNYTVEVEGYKEVAPANEILLVDRKGGNKLGYKPTEEERLAMDWVIIQD